MNEELTKEEREEIIEQAKSLAKSPDDVILARSIVCKFYQDGDCPEVFSHDGCNGCADDEDVMGCRAEYLKRIFRNPMKVWSKEFDAPIIREKSRKFSDMPEIGLKCDTCHLAEHCPEAMTDATCSIDWSGGVDSKNPKDMIAHLIDMQNERINKAKAVEAVEGGVPDGTLSTEIDRLTGLIETKAELETDRVSLKIEAEGKGKQGTGILAQLLGTKPPKPELEEPVQDAITIQDIEDIKTPEPEPVLAEDAPKKKKKKKRKS